jgi:hypothetical protein
MIKDLLYYFGMVSIVLTVLMCLMTVGWAFLQAYKALKDLIKDIFRYGR